MSSEQTFSTNDLRSAAVDYKRDSEHKHKWALGQAWGPGREDTAHARPARLEPRAQPVRRDHQHNMGKARKHGALNEPYVSDSSADEEVDEASAAPEPDAEITYSYDADRGPGHGSQILSLALAKAVERFEDQTTNKLVKDEYEVLDNEVESVPPTPLKNGKRGVEEEDYEFI